jgi:metal-responsive CopG/Arc/MetJ family transcriptional regulator
MALGAGKRVTTIVLDADLDRLLARAAGEQGVSRSEFVRRQLRRALEKYRHHPRPSSAGVVRRRLRERGDERELYRDLER